MSIERKIDIFKCYKCNGTGKLNKKKCDVCYGTGKWEESTYYFIDEKNKIAMDGDTLS